MTKRLIILGSTGSIGTQALEVAAHLGEQIQVVGLAARSNVDLLLRQVAEFRPQAIALADQAAAERARNSVSAGVRVFDGLSGVTRLVEEWEADLVLAAMVGLDGLEPALAALRTGKSLALANKEILVGAGEMVMGLAREKSLPILPVDSEHSAIFQCLAGEVPASVARLILTASGGPFRGMSRTELAQVRPEAALKHPRWSMGPKVTVDSATMMNKGLEVIEARNLFDIPADRIDVAVHPESLVHSMVEFIDGSVKAQLGPTDMRLPIQLALTYPRRCQNHFERMDLIRAGRLNFEPPDLGAFPCLRLAYQAAEAGGTLPTVLNAANEVAVKGFLTGVLGFLGIPELVERVMELYHNVHPENLDEIKEADAWAREKAGSFLASAHSLRR